MSIINSKRSARWLQTFAQIMEVDRLTPVASRSIRKQKFPVRRSPRSEIGQGKEK
ncbi:hypothetical protein [Thiolapillus sp.]